MTFDAIKYIYITVLKFNSIIKYLGADKYKITEYYNGNKYWEREYKNGIKQ